jgi:serine/threonine protein kinase/lipoprotein NlpI
LPKICSRCRSVNPDASAYCSDCGTSLDAAAGAAVDHTRTAAALPADLKRGSLFAGRYEIIELLGCGGMGRVYRAEDRKVHEEIALKILSPDIATDPSTIERFSNELKLARKIAHRNVCKMYDLGEADGMHYLAMEYVAGEDLKNMIRMSGALGVGTTIKLAKQTCAGLAEAHRLGVIHRDLKPSNIMIDKEGVSHIMDFGIARSIKMKGITRVGLVVGTPEYMSPEQVEAEEPDQRSDIYSLGVILYEMVTGRVPFGGDTPFAVGMKHKSETPKDPKEINPGLPESLCRLIMTCLEKKKEKRYQNVEQMLFELEKIEAEIPTSQWLELEKGTKRKTLLRTLGPFRVLGILGLGAALFIAGYILYDRILRPESPGPPAEAGPAAAEKLIAILPFDDLSPGRNNSYFSEGLTDEIIGHLSRIKSIRVFSRTSAMILKTTQKDIRAMGQDFSIDYVLEGSVRKADGDVKITVQLTDTANGTQIWGEEYGGTLNDIFEIQDSLSRSIVDELKLKLTPDENAGIASRPIDSVPAYDFYLKARQEIWSWSEDGLKRAREYLQQGLNIVGKNVLLYAGMGYVFWQFYNTGISQDPADLRQVKDFADKIFELEPDSSYGHLLLGLYYTMSDNQMSVRHLKQVLAKDPNNADALFWLTAVYGHVGKTDAAAPLVERLLKIDPFNPINHSLPGWLLFFKGRFEQALGPFQKMVQMMPDNPVNRGLYAVILIYNKRYEEAFALIDGLARDDPKHFLAHLGLFWKYALQGKKPEALREVNEEMKAVAARDITFSWLTAIGYAILQERKQALDWLEVAVNLGFINYPFLSELDPFLETIRGEERFLKLMEKVKRDWEKFEI